MKIVRLLVIGCLSATLAGCAFLSGAEPRDLWGRQQTAYNSLLATAVDMRRPCVEIGPDDPGCLINDATYGKVEFARQLADGYLKAADAAIAAGDDKGASFYLKSAAGALAALAVYVNRPIPEGVQ